MSWNIGAFPEAEATTLTGSGNLLNKLNTEPSGSGRAVHIGSGELLNKLNTEYPRLGTGSCRHIGSGELLNKHIFSPMGTGYDTIDYFYGSGELLNKRQIIYGRNPKTYYFSVGISTADLKIASKITISRGLATFSVEQTGNIGSGDVITYDTNKTVYIKYKVGNVWSVQSSTATYPDDIILSDVVSIKRSFNSLNAAIGSSGGAPISTGIVSVTGSGDFVSNNISVYVTCYNDAADTTPVLVKGYISNAYYNRFVVSAAGINMSDLDEQREYNYFSNRQNTTITGAPEEGYTLKTSGACVLDIDDVIMHINNLDVCGTATIGIRYRQIRSSDEDINFRIKNCIVHNTGTYGIHVAAGSTAIRNMSLWSNLIFGQSVSDIYLEGQITRAYIYNCLLDKGAGSCKGVKTSGSVGALDMGWNLIVGGTAGNDIDSSVVDVFFNNYLNDTAYIGVDRNLLIADPDTMFTDRDNGLYTPLNTSAQHYLSGLWDSDTVPFAETFYYDLAGNLRTMNYICVGPLEMHQAFEFNGSYIKGSDSQKLNYYPSTLISTLDGMSYYAYITGVLSQTHLDYSSEDKIAIYLNNVEPLMMSGQRYTTLFTFRAIYDKARKMIFVEKSSKYNFAFFSKLAGSRNYIFNYDLNKRLLTVGTIDQLENGMSGKKNIVNMVRR